MKKYLIFLCFLLVLPFAQACLCTDLFTLATGIRPFVNDFSGQWHSDVSCGEDETDEPYRWGVDLNESETGKVTGTIYFHDCPGGGAVTYSVEGDAIEGQPVLYLHGTRIDGRYILFMSSPETQEFEIMYGASPQPNFVE
ncbi:hypothetical protein KQH62_00565 [bacterium]|nr:hypothetical protein [bacterium]